MLALVAGERTFSVAERGLLLSFLVVVCVRLFRWWRQSIASRGCDSAAVVPGLPQELIALLLRGKAQVRKWTPSESG